MWDGCVEIVLGFDTKDGCDWFAVGSRLRGGLRTVEDWFSFPKVIGVGKRLQDGWGNGCVEVELALRLPRRRADVRPWTLPLRGERVEEIGAI